MALLLGTTALAGCDESRDRDEDDMSDGSTGGTPNADATDSGSTGTTGLGNPITGLTLGATGTTGTTATTVTKTTGNDTLADSFGDDGSAESSGEDTFAETSSLPETETGGADETGPDGDGDETDGSGATVDTICNSIIDYYRTCGVLDEDYLEYLHTECITSYEAQLPEGACLEAFAAALDCFFSYPCDTEAEDICLDEQAAADEACAPVAGS